MKVDMGKQEIMCSSVWPTWDMKSRMKPTEKKKHCTNIVISFHRSQCRCFLKQHYESLKKNIKC